MKKGTKGSGSKTVAKISYVSSAPVKTTVAKIGYVSSAPVKTTVAKIGYVSSAPVKTTVTLRGGKGGSGGEGSYQTKSKITYVDKQSGSYTRATTKERALAGEFHHKNGTSGIKSEYKKSETVRVGNKTGYTEVYNEQRVRNVSYSKNTGGSKKLHYV